MGNSREFGNLIGLEKVADHGIQRKDKGGKKARENKTGSSMQKIIRSLWLNALQTNWLNSFLFCLSLFLSFQTKRDIFLYTTDRWRDQKDPEKKYWWKDMSLILLGSKCILSTCKKKSKCCIYFYFSDVGYQIMSVS